VQLLTSEEQISNNRGKNFRRILTIVLAALAIAI
jgi:hypothetical protein